MYGATKLASELLIEEYRAMYGLRAVVNRCGVISGPWQMGKVDQGFVVLWAARHLYGGRSRTSDSAARDCRFATCSTSPISTTSIGMQMADMPNAIPARSTTWAAAVRAASRWPS